MPPAERGLDDGLICADGAADMDLLAAGEDGAHHRRDERRGCGKHLLGEQRNKLAGMASAAQHQAHALAPHGDVGKTDALAGGEMADGSHGLGRADELLVTNWTRRLGGHDNLPFLIYDSIKQDKKIVTNDTDFI